MMPRVWVRYGLCVAVLWFSLGVTRFRNDSMGHTLQCAASPRWLIMGPFYLLSLLTVTSYHHSHGHKMRLHRFKGQPQNHLTAQATTVMGSSTGRYDSNESTGENKWSHDSRICNMLRVNTTTRPLFDIDIRSQLPNNQRTSPR
jgi:hypothetical protein